MHPAGPAIPAAAAGPAVPPVRPVPVAPAGPPVPPAPPAPPAPTGTGPPRWPTVVLSLAAIAVGLWIVAGTALAQAVVWLLSEAFTALDMPVPAATWIVLALVNAVLVAGPAAALAALTRMFAPGLQGVRAASTGWAVAGAAAGILGCVRAVPVVHNELLLLLTTALALAVAVVVARLRLPRGRVSYSGGPGVPGLALTAGLIVLLPWLWIGALGGLVETVLAVTAAAAVGRLAASVLDGAFFAGFARSRPWQMLVGGSAAGVVLVVLGSGVGGPGVSLAVMLLLPALGFAAAALAALAAPAGSDRLATAGPARAGVALLVGTAAVGPLAFVDPEETTLQLGVADVAAWALAATVLSVLLALAVGGGYGLALNPRGRRPPRWLPVATAVIVATAGGVVYGLAGQPGRYGERLLVIMSDQADLSGLDAIAGRPARLRATYRRLVEHAERTQASLRKTLDRWGLSYTPYYLVNGVLVDAGPVVRAWLSGRSDVDRVLLDQRLRPLPRPAPVMSGNAPVPDGSPEWNIRMIGADRVWRELDTAGDGIVIGTSDSGVDGGHPALRDGYRGGDDSWYDPWNGTAAPTDRAGHGTHALGSALGRAGIGVAPAADWIGCVNLDRNLGSPSRYLDCLQFLLAPFPRGGDPLRDGRPERAAHILTNSWGCPGIEGCDADALRPATAALRATGIFVVAAAGNTGPRCSSVQDPPAPYPDVVTVGAVDSGGVVSDFSSRGPAAGGLAKPDLVAPGVAVTSAWPGGGYAEESGTSMATPHLAGVVALMWSANPALIGDVDATAAILRQTARPASPGDRAATECGGVRNRNVAGAGIVDAYAAVRLALARPP